MSDRFEDFDESEPSSHPPFPVLSWAAVFLVLAFILNPGLFIPGLGKNPKPAVEEDPEPLANETMLVKLIWGMQIVSETPSDTIVPKLDAIEKKGPTENLALSIVEALTTGPAAAAKRVEGLTDKVKGTPLEPSHKIVSEWIKRLADDPNASIDDPSRADLEKQLGWFAKLPGQSTEILKKDRFWEKEPESLFGKMVIGALKISALLLVVFAILIVGTILLIWFGIRSTRGPFGPGLLMNDDGPDASAILMQTFAIWFVGYFSLSLVFQIFVIPATGMNPLAASVIVQATSLAALYWPIHRGMSPSVLAQQIGLGPKTGSPREVVVGITGTLAFWPILLFLAFISMVLAQSVPGAEPPVHPLAKKLPDGPQFDWVLGFLTACVMAPLVEEIFFRGCLYRHLRETALGAGPGLALALSVGISAVLFAVIHPQGLFGLPVLGGLGAYFALLREWRNNLTASIAAHAMVNTTTLFLLTFI